MRYSIRRNMPPPTHTHTHTYLHCPPSDGPAGVARGGGHRAAAGNGLGHGQALACAVRTKQLHVPCRKPTSLTPPPLPCSRSCACSSCNAPSEPAYHHSIVSRHCMHVTAVLWCLCLGVVIDRSSNALTGEGVPDGIVWLADTLTASSKSGGGSGRGSFAITPSPSATTAPAGGGSGSQTQLAA